MLGCVRSSAYPSGCTFTRSLPNSASASANFVGFNFNVWSAMKSCPITYAGKAIAPPECSSSHMPYRLAAKLIWVLTSFLQ